MAASPCERSPKQGEEKMAKNVIKCKLVDRHICHMTNRQKAKVLWELQDAVKRFQCLEPKKLTRYEEKDLPVYLKKKLPKFKFNHELVPLISSCQTIEVRFTTNPKCAENQHEDPNVVYARIPTPGNPFKSEDFSDVGCSQMCSRTNETEKTKSQISQNQNVPLLLVPLPCPVHDGTSGLGEPYQCTHHPNCPGIVMCRDPQTGQSCLCTVHVQRPLSGACAQKAASMQAPKSQAEGSGPKDIDCRKPKLEESAQKATSQTKQKPKTNDSAQKK